MLQGNCDFHSWMYSMLGGSIKLFLINIPECALYKILWIAYQFTFHNPHVQFRSS